MNGRLLPWCLHSVWRGPTANWLWPVINGTKCSGPDTCCTEDSCIPPFAELDYLRDQGIRQQYILEAIHLGTVLVCVMSARGLRLFGGQPPFFCSMYRPTCRHTWFAAILHASPTFTAVHRCYSVFHLCSPLFTAVHRCSPGRTDSCEWKSFHNEPAHNCSLPGGPHDQDFTQWKASITVRTKATVLVLVLIPSYD